MKVQENSFEESAVSLLNGATSLIATRSESNLTPENSSNLDNIIGNLAKNSTNFIKQGAHGGLELAEQALEGFLNKELDTIPIPSMFKDGLKALVSNGLDTATKAVGGLLDTMAFG